MTDSLYPKHSAINGDTEVDAEVERLRAQLAARDGTIRTMHEDSLAAVRETVAERDQARADLAEIKSEVEAVLSAGPSIRVCEGGGPESLGASLAVTVSKLRSEVQSLKHPRAFNMFGYDEVRTERDALKAKLAEAERQRDVARGMTGAVAEGSACWEERARKAEARVEQLEAMSELRRLKAKTEQPAPKDDARAKALAALEAGLNALGMHGPCTNNSCAECARAARLMTEAISALRQTNTTTEVAHG